MKLLLHTCCGPCTIYPYSVLRKDHDISAYFFNPNIHPFKEFQKRKETLLSYCRENRIDVYATEPYGLQEFLRKVVFHESERCNSCYTWRMQETAKNAAEHGFDGFSTTLLYSRYQNHIQLKTCGEALAKKYAVEFVYRDFREGWQEGIDVSREKAMYRQPYCGCIYSEQERYDKSFKKTKQSLI